MTTLTERSLATKARYQPKRKAKPVAREVADIVGQEVEIIETSGSTALHALPTFIGCYGVVVETSVPGTDLVLVRVAGRGAAWVKRYLVRS